MTARAGETELFTGLQRGIWSFWLESGENVWWQVCAQILFQLRCKSLSDNIVPAYLCSSQPLENKCEYFIDLLYIIAFIGR